MISIMKITKTDTNSNTGNTHLKKYFLDFSILDQMFCIFSIDVASAALAYAAGLSADENQVKVLSDTLQALVSHN